MKNKRIKRIVSILFVLALSVSMAVSASALTNEV